MFSDNVEITFGTATFLGNDCQMTACHYVSCMVGQQGFPKVLATHPFEMRANFAMHKGAYALRFTLTRLAGPCMLFFLQENTCSGYFSAFASHRYHHEIEVMLRGTTLPRLADRVYT